jgi:hypothetical protein
MALLRRHQGLADQIPDDVRERARRAGAEDLDWYAGRLDIEAVQDRGADTPPAERVQFEALAERHRTEAAGSGSGGMMSLFHSLGRLLSPTPR